MISKILIASIRARLTEVTTPGKQGEQAFLKLAQIHTLNIHSLFKKNKTKWMSHACSFQRHVKSLRTARREPQPGRRSSARLQTTPLPPAPPEGIPPPLGKRGFILPPLSMKEKNSCRDAPSGHYGLFCSTEDVAWKQRPPVRQRASPCCWAPGGAGRAAACRQVPRLCETSLLIPGRETPTTAAASTQCGVG